MAAAMARIHLKPGQPIPAGWPCGTRRTCIPPEAQLDAPDWFSPIDVGRVPASGLADPRPRCRPARGRRRSLDGPVRMWPGRPATRASKTSRGRAEPAPSTASWERFRSRCSPTWPTSATARWRTTPGRPAGAAADGAWPVDPYPNPDPERHAFQIRLTVHEAAHPANIGRYRKTLFAYRDDGNLAGWPKPVGPADSASRARHRIGRRDVSPPLRRRRRQQAGRPAGHLERRALRAPLRRHPGGELQRRQPGEDGPDDAVAETTALTRRCRSRVNHFAFLRSATSTTITRRRSSPPRESTSTPGTWTARAWRASPCASTRAFSDPCNPGAPHPCFDASDRQLTEHNHLKRGFIGSPMLADLTGDRQLDIVAGALDQHLYAWDGSGDSLPGFPVKLVDPRCGRRGDRRLAGARRARRAAPA